MIKPIYLYGSQTLRGECELFPLDDKAALDALVVDLKETLKASDGVGLAAPQIGVLKRVVIVDGNDLKDTYDYLDGFTRTLVNPVVTWESEKTADYEEGCLSVPGVYGSVRRPASITVEYYDENLEKKTETFEGFACRMVQHELDHLDGTLFVDKVAPVRKKIIAKKLLSIAKGKVSTRYKTKY